MSNKRTKKSNYTRGGQILFHNLRMFIQINAAIFKWIMLSILALTAFMSYLMIDYPTLMGTVYFWKYQFLNEVQPTSTVVKTTWEGVKYTSTLGAQLQNQILIDYNHTFLRTILISFSISLVLGIGALLFSMRMFRKKGDEQTEEYFIRGIQKATPKQLAKQLKKKNNQSDFKLDGKAIFKRNFEVQHMLFDGTTGAGKSVALRKFLRWIRDRGDKAVVYDKGCTFVSKFYNEKTDVILNPFDERCAFWDVWCDAKEASDFENMAAALIPMHGDGDPFWVQSARTIFCSTAFRMVKEPNRTTERLLEIMLTSELESLSEYLKGTESASLVSDKIQKTAISIKSVLAAYIKSLRFLAGLDTEGENGQLIRRRFSIRDWVKDDNENGFLFLSSNAQQHASLRPLISMWLSIASTAILEQNENVDRRIWVIMDEAPSLHKLPELAETIAEVRKFGGCYVIGIQSFAQLKKVYGDNAALEMFDLLNTRLFFRSPSNEMAKISSLDLGEQEVDVSKEQYSYGANEIRDGVSLGHQTITRPVVTASEIMQLEDLQFWLRTPGDYPVTQIDLVFDKMPSLCPPFIKRKYTPSNRIKALELSLNYHQFSAVAHLDKEDKTALQAIHDEMYAGDENNEERANEAKRMNKLADKSNAVAQSLIDMRKDKSAKPSIAEGIKKRAEQSKKQQQENNQQAEAALLHEEQQIASSDNEMSFD
ncbi:type IV conjugative transfer system coupling protein TraD [uncultured Shewanella sp.]|uniref:type IV conjugative transfer system coupling protein TraD n=1 Tax=uncultured Shewanella sp. TaxID=173975 RepID=UPI002620F85E|nr:type IV conjugative transfer system coupling protein TraD [uncultured Shewanella sp.]